MVALETVTPGRSANATSARDRAFEPSFVAPLAHHFDYPAEGLPDVIREDIVAAHRRAWARLAHPGTWWNAEERVAIAAESRAAAYCDLCRARRRALSPYAADAPTGKRRHASVSAAVLPAAAIDAIHRLVTDASRLTGDYVAGLAKAGLPDTHYVELLSIVVSLRSIDAFHRALGLAPEPMPRPLPESETGPPTRRRPGGTESDSAWVPLLVPSKAEPQDEDLFPGPMAPYVIRALSLVPDAVRWLKDLSAAHYLAMEGSAMMNFVQGRGPLSRAQTELVAGRVSAVNECFY